MCGIFGWALRDNNFQSREMLARLTDLMYHRGPDGSGYWLHEASDGAYQIGAGHRRLSIIDIAGGTQPMLSEDGRFVLSFNGEIYNYIELKEELIALGHQFRTKSDTEVLIESFRAWDVSAIARFRGMFAFSLWDHATERLVLARDAFGKKPLFLAQRNGSLVFASEMEAIVQFPGIDRTFDRAALSEYLIARYVPGPSTFFSSVKKMLPGHYGIWNRGKFSEERYFTPPFARTPPDVSSFQTAIELFEETFDDAVRIRMRSDAPFGAFLSGGVDSSAVVAAMVKHSNKAVRTFSVGFAEAQYSELDYARTVATEFGTNHCELVVDSKMFFENWPDAVLHRGAPISEPSDIPIFLLSKMSSQTVKMVLTGEGADELMGGYPKHKAEAWIRLYQKMVPRLLHDQIVGPLIASLPYGVRRLKTVALAAGERKLSERFLLWFGGVSLKQRNAMLEHKSGEPESDPIRCLLRHESPLREILLFDQLSWLPDNLLERGDRMMMAGSIEGRMPFMDTELAGVIARLPDEYLVGGRGGKRVLRAAMSKLLPRHILDRKKVGFRVPIGEWFRGPYREYVKDMLISRTSSVGTICDRGALNQIVDEHLGGRQNHEKLLWSLINLEMFIRTFKPGGLPGGGTKPESIL